MSRAEKTEADRKAIEEWLSKKGNNITICEPEARTPDEDIVYTFKVGSRGRKSAPIVTKSPHDKS
jgi:hypothetical protein|tara:strand:- start:104 stop:298 length:195 start_codon:yes stop_codon:yes gene_type:complete